MLAINSEYPKIEITHKIIFEISPVIYYLQEQLKNLRNDLETTQSDLRALREREEQWDASRFQLETKLRDKEGETQRLNLLQTNLESEKQVNKSCNLTFSTITFCNSTSPNIFSP